MWRPRDFDAARDNLHARALVSKGLGARGNSGPPSTWIPPRGTRYLVARDAAHADETGSDVGGDAGFLCALLNHSLVRGVTRGDSTRSNAIEEARPRGLIIGPSPEPQVAATKGFKRRSAPANHLATVATAPTVRGSARRPRSLAVAAINDEAVREAAVRGEPKEGPCSALDDEARRRVERRPNGERL
jgi:hypothetical protein